MCFMIYTFFYVLSVIKPIRMKRPVHVARMTVKQNLYKVSPPDAEASGSLGRQRLKRKNNIKTDVL